MSGYREYFVLKNAYTYECECVYVCVCGREVEGDTPPHTHTT